MENKESKFKWKTKNNGTIFGLCLVGVAAFSVLLATGQVKQAQREKENLVGEQTALENNLGENADGSFVPQVDAALQNALENPEGVLDEALTLDDGTLNGVAGELEGASSNGIAEEGTERETDLAGEEAALAASAAGNGSLNSEGALTANAVGDGSLVGDENSAQEVGLTGDGVSAQILPSVSFDEADILSWPVAGNVVLDYSMDGSIYFPTLKQYKYNPALVIGSDEGAQVVASAKGIVESIDIDDETGTTIVMSLGNGYKLKYGQLQELAVAEGDVVEQGDLIGYVSQPTKYYCMEGTNLYFAMTKDEEPVDPILYLE